MDTREIHIGLTNDEEIRSKAIKYSVELLVGRGIPSWGCCSADTSGEPSTSPEEVHVKYLHLLKDDVLELAVTFTEFIKSGKTE